MTGRSPGNHGVFDFIWAEQRKKDHYFTLYNFRDIQCETIWSIVSRQNGSICSLNFPFMSPPPEISGMIVPGFVSWKHLRLNVYPRQLYDEIRALPGFNAKELAWDFDLEKKAERGVPKDEFENWIAFHIRREKQWFEIARYLMAHKPSDLMAILFDGPDKISHMGWRFLDPAFFPDTPSAWERKIRDLCFEYFQALDGFLAEIISAADPAVRIFITSDHGFGPSRIVFRVNSWLHSQGYLTWKTLDGLDEKSREGAEKVIERHFVLLDWDKTTAYARTVTSNGIYIRVAKGPDDKGVPADRYDAFRTELIEKLSAIQDPATGQPIIRHVWTKEEVFPGPHNAQAPDLTLVMQDHSFVSILNKNPIVYHRPEIEGTHFPEGIFLAQGPGIRQGVRLSPLSILEAAPCLLYSLGLDIPSDFEGRLPEDVFEQAFLKKHPPVAGEPTRLPDSYALKVGKKAPDADEQAQIYKQMKALGYIE
jgi:predicted AlkP superfamily phosphohydrolase/phosphomutase